MLKDVVDKAKNRGVDRTGICKFCGQQALVKGLDEFQDEDMNELATELCQCTDAKIYTIKKCQKERAHAKIEIMFEDEADDIAFTPDQLLYLHNTVEPVVEDVVKKISIDVQDEVKMVITKNNRGMVKITRKDATSRSYEA